jgi:ABC transport system ATP-binding/permease protein
LLAFLMAHFIKYSAGRVYIFSENENLPVYLFMCVITSLFLGLIISAEEIIKDRKILKRESFLNLSWFSYLNSKIMIMFLISAIQAILFVLIGNLVMEIRGMTFSYWIILFSTSCIANMIGLNISSAFNSVITIYILIPFILIPQFLFSGGLLKFDKLHLSNHSFSEFVPVIGDIWPARWSYEALAVEQFKNNKYERNFFNYDVEISQNNWLANFLIAELKKDLLYCQKNRDSVQYSGKLGNKFKILDYHLDKLSQSAGFNPVPGEMTALLSKEKFNSEAAKEINKYLDSLAIQFRHFRNKYWNLKESEIRSIEARIGRKEYIKLKDNYYNERLEFWVLDRERIDQSTETRNKIIRKFEPGFMKPIAKNGRAQFYAPNKMIGNQEIDTFWFNILVLWFVSFILYITLYFNLLQKALSYFENLQFAKSGR